MTDWNMLYVEVLNLEDRIVRWYLKLLFNTVCLKSSKCR
jgi:hypothetical protein